MIGALAILAVCVVEWAAAVADTVVETHDRIVGAIWRDAKKICDTRVAEAQVEIEATLAGFETLGSTLLMAKGDEAALAGAVDAVLWLGWSGKPCRQIWAAQSNRKGGCSGPCCKGVPPVQTLCTADAVGIGYHLRGCGPTFAEGSRGHPRKTGRASPFASGHTRC